MYTPPTFREQDPIVLQQIMREARLATLVTATDEGLMASERDDDRRVAAMVRTP